jgi:hypothetical protein
MIQDVYFHHTSFLPESTHKHEIVLNAPHEVIADVPKTDE